MVLVTQHVKLDFLVRYPPGQDISEDGLGIVDVTWVAVCLAAGAFDCVFAGASLAFDSCPE